MPYQGYKKRRMKRKSVYRGRLNALYRGRISYQAGSYARSYVPKYGSFKLRGVLDVSSTGTAFNFGYRITQPDAIDGSSTSLTDWASIVSLYDEYRVTGIKLYFIPKRPNDPGSTISYEPGYVFMDTDSTGLSATVAQAVGYDNCKVVNLYRPFKLYFKIPKLLNTASTTVAFPGWGDTASTFATGAIYFIGQSLTSGTDYGQMILTYYIKTHNRK